MNLTIPLATNLDEVQHIVREWELDNFPLSTDLHRALIICEEAGELAHVVLKQDQGIRPESSKDSDLRDAIGDVSLGLMNLCSSRGWSLWNIIKEVSEEVTARDWKNQS